MFDNYDELLRYATFSGFLNCFTNFAIGKLFFFSGASHFSENETNFYMPVVLPARLFFFSPSDLRCEMSFLTSRDMCCVLLMAFVNGRK